MMRKQKLLGYIDKVSTLVEGREGLIKKIRLYLWKPISHNRWTVGLMSKRTYGNLWHIDGQWVSGQNVLMFLFFFAQLPLQELKFIGQFNFSLALPDIVANKTLGESALPGKFFYQSYVSKPFASTPCLGDLAFLFFIFFKLLFFMSSHRKSNLFPRSCSEIYVRPVADEFF